MVYGDPQQHMANMKFIFISSNVFKKGDFNKSNNLFKFLNNQLNGLGKATNQILK